MSASLRPSPLFDTDENFQDNHHRNSEEYVDDVVHEDHDGEDDYDDDELPLLMTSRQRSPTSKKKQRNKRISKYDNDDDNDDELYQCDESARTSRKKATILSLSLCTILLAFWLLDSLKDPVFAVLSGDLKRYQPTAKMISVLCMIAQVCSMEYISKETQKRKRRAQAKARRMQMNDHYFRPGDFDAATAVNPGSDVISADLFFQFGIPYCIFFWVIAYSLSKHDNYTSLSPPHDNSRPSIVNVSAQNDDTIAWKFLGYFMYVAIESFGSISVATFWSFCNASLDLESAKNNYGLIIAVAQIGAISGSTVATRVENIDGGIPTLFFLAGLIILLNMIIMKFYLFIFSESLPVGVARQVLSRRNKKRQPVATHVRDETRYSRTNPTIHKGADSNANVFMSGVYLIVRHNYLLLILGTSCLYEVALTCLDYDMKVVGLAKFQHQAEAASFELSATSTSNMVDNDFTIFMGHYGQLTNFISLLLSYFGFPYLMSKFGLRITLRVFPLILFSVTIVVFTLPPNLWIVFICMALLKATTFSINDPAKEILYIPTSHTVKLKAKFWIDVVGARMAKAIGSIITQYAGNADRIQKYGSIPSIFTSALLLGVSIAVGGQFDWLVRNETIVGLEEEEEDAALELLRDNEGYNNDDCARYKLAKDDDEYDSDDDDHYQFGGKFQRDFDDETERSIWESDTTIELTTVR